MARTKKSESQKPTTPGMAIEAEFTLPADLAAAIESHHRECCESEAHEDEWHAGRGALVDGAMDATLGDLIQHAAEFDSRKPDLEQLRAARFYRGKELNEQVIPFAKQAEQQAKTEYEAVVQKEMQRFIESGAAEALPAWGKPAGEIQLRHRVEQEHDVMAAKAKLRRAAGKVHELESAAQVPVGQKRCAIDAPSAVELLIDRIRQARQPQRAESRPSEKVQKVLGLCGLENAAWLPEHIAIAEQAAAHVPGNLAGVVFRVTRHLPPAVAEKFAECIRKLPRTAARDEALGRIKDHAATFARKSAPFEPERPRTAYADQPTGFKKAIEASST